VPHQNKWHGTFCGDGGVHTLDLKANNLRGLLPTEIGALPHLSVLRLQSNPLLSGTLPTQVGNLQNLMILDMRNSSLSGTLPEELLVLNPLIFIDVQANRISGTLPSKRSWPDVVHLNLASNSISGSLPELGVMREINYLSMHTNRLSGTLPTEIGLLTNLRDRPYYHTNRLSGTLPTQLGLMTHVAIPSLYHNSIRGFWPSELGNLNQLAFPALSYNLLSGTTPSEFTAAAWRNVDARMDIESNRMTNHCWEKYCRRNAELRTEDQRYAIEQAISDRDLLRRQLDEPTPTNWWSPYSRCTFRTHTFGRFQCSVSDWTEPPVRNLS